MTEHVLEELFKAIKQFVLTILDSQLSAKQDIDEKDRRYLQQTANNLAMNKFGDVKAQLELEIPKALYLNIENYLLVKIEWQARITLHCRARGITDLTEIDEISCTVGLAFAEAIAHGKKIENTRKFINGIIRHKVSDFIAKKGRIQGCSWPEEIISIEEVPLPKFFPGITKIKLIEVVHQCIKELDADEITIVRMRYFEGVTLEEIGKILAKDHTTISYRLTQIYQKMKSLIIGELEDQV